MINIGNIKPGDKVRILDYSVCDPDPSLNGAYKKYSNSIMTVVQNEGRYLRMKEDNGRSSWWGVDIVEIISREKIMDQIADNFGLKLDMHFNIKEFPWYSPYKFTKDGLFHSAGPMNGDHIVWAPVTNDYIWTNLLTDKYAIESLPQTTILENIYKPTTAKAKLSTFGRAEYTYYLAMIQRADDTGKTQCKLLVDSLHPLPERLKDVLLLDGFDLKLRQYNCLNEYSCEDLTTRHCADVFWDSDASGKLR